MGKKNNDLISELDEAPLRLKIGSEDWKIVLEVYCGKSKSWWIKKEK